jgi:predicted nucleotidyltransferase
MAKQEKINENFSLSYTSRDENTGDSVMDVTINFDNPKSDTIIINRLNTWLKSIGRDTIEVAYNQAILSSEKK